MLYGKSKLLNMRVIYGTVVHVYFNRISIELILFIPENRIFIHIQYRIFRIELHRIANSLQIYPIKTDSIIGLDFTRCGIYCDHTQRIGMQEKRIFLRKFNKLGAVRC